MKKLLLLSLLAIGVIFTSCIDIVEEIHLNKNQSGTYTMTLDMSEMGQLLKSFGDQESGDEEITVEEEEVEIMEEGDVVIADEEITEDSGDPMGGLGELSNMTADLANKIKNIPGITNIQESSDTVNFLFTYSFDFADINALNEAMVASHDEADPNTQFFKGTKKSFVRTTAGSIADEFTESFAGDDEMEENLAMAKMMFGDMKIRTIYTFDRKVKNVSSPAAEVSNDKKQVVLDYYLFDEDKNKGATGTDVTFKLR